MPEAHLSAGVTAYFHLIDGPDKAKVAELFTSDATVVDDGRTYHGRQAIHAWLTGPANAFTTTSTHLSAEQNENRSATVLILLEGNFPGGRVELRHEFEQQSDGLIRTLHIIAV